MKILVLLITPLLSLAQPSKVLVRDTIYSQSTQTFNGSVNITLSTPIPSGGFTVQPVAANYQISSGLFTMYLVPNGSTGSYYTFKYQSGQSVSQTTCIFPQVPGPITLTPYCNGNGYFVPWSPFLSKLNSGTQDVLCALGGDTIVGITCQSANANTITPFSTSVVIPANALNQTVMPVRFLLGGVATGTPAAAVLTVKLDSVSIFVSQSLSLPLSSGSANSIVCIVTSALTVSSTSPVTMTCDGYTNTLINNTNPSVSIATNATHTLTFNVAFASATAGNAIWLGGITQ